MQLHTSRDQLFLSTVRIRTDGATATAFLFRLGGKEPQNGTYLVTNRHVVEGAVHGQVFFLRGENRKPVLGSPYMFEMHQEFASLWTFHPDRAVDVAVAPVDAFINDPSTTIELGNIAIPESLALNEATFISDRDVENFSFLRVLPGALEEVEEVLFVGYPEGYYDRHHNLPVVRRGITASPISVDHEGEPQFLIDAVVLAGSSGSPVFIADSRIVARITGQLGKERFLFLGIVSDMLLKKRYSPQQRDARTEYLDALVGLGAVYKPKAIVNPEGSFTRCDRRTVGNGAR